MIQTNLIPDVKQELLRAQAQRNTLISIAILAAASFVVLVILAAGYVYGAQALIVKNTNVTIDEEYEKLRSVQDLDKMLTIQNQLQVVSSLNQDKRINSRVYDMLNVIVPSSPHQIGISSVEIGGSDETADETDGATAEGGTVVTIEGQAVGSYASLEVFEKMIAAAVIQYKSTDESESELKCSKDEAVKCRYLAVGGGDRSTAVRVSETSYTDNQDGSKTLFFKLSFTVVPELFSNKVSDVGIKIGQDGNVTDSYLAVPRSVFADVSDDSGGEE